MAKKHKRFRRKGGADAQFDQKLSKTARELYEGLREEDLELEGMDFEEAWHEGGAGDRFRRPAHASRLPARAPSAQTVRDEVGETNLGPRREGTVCALASGIAWVDDDVGARHECVLPTRLAANQQSSIAVGDRVLWAPVATSTEDGQRGATSEQGPGDLRVVEVLPRSTFLARPDPLNPRLQRVVAANVDVVVQVASVVKPPLRPALVDRYLIAIQQGGAQPVLCINKSDLLADDGRAEAEEQLAQYRAMDLPLLWMSAKSGDGLAELRRLLHGKTAAFVGHSGVGKSSLINALEPEARAATGAVRDVSGTGRHTTTRSDLYDLGDFRLIDTPGIRELGLWDLDATSLRDYFPEFAEASSACRFRDCSHFHEPECSVRRAVELGDLSRRRYETYLRILESLDEA